MKVPCDLKIPGAVPICKAPPLDLTVPPDPMPQLANLTTLLVEDERVATRTDGRREFRLEYASERCPYPFMLVGQKCMSVLSVREDMTTDQSSEQDVKMLKGDCKSFYSSHLLAQVRRNSLQCSWCFSLGRLLVLVPRKQS